MVAIPRAEAFQGRLARRVLERGGRVDQPSVEEHPSGPRARSLPIGHRHGHRPAGEGRAVDPGQGGSAARELLLDDASAGLVDGRVGARRQRRQERRLAAAGTPGDHD